MTSSRQGLNKISQFSRFLEFILESFQYFFHEIFIVARFYRVLAADIKRLLISALNEAQSPDFGHFLTIWGILRVVCLGTSL